MSVVLREMEVESTADRPARAIWAERIVRWVLGGVLILAAALKGHQVATEPLGGTGLLSSRWFLIALVEFEFLLGAALFLRLAPRLTWWIALGTFSSFSVASLHEALQGSPSCGCFGKAMVSPWITTIFDIGAIFVLLWSPPRRANSFQPASAQRVGTMIASVIALGALPTLLGFRPSALVRGPDLVVDSNFHDFGTITPSQGIRVDHEFRIENRGPQPVRILKAKSTCSCTVAELPNNPVPPGGYALIHVTGRWGNRLGRQREQVLLTTDSMTQGTIALSITADIVAPVVYWPTILDFGTIIQGQAATRILTIAPGKDREKFNILSVRSDDRRIALQRDVAMPARDGEHRWIVELKSDSPMRKVRSLAHFKVDARGSGSVDVPIHYTVLPAIRALPEALVLWASRTGESRSLVVTTTVVIDEVSIDSSDLDPASFAVEIVSWSKVEEGWRYRLSVRLVERNVGHMCEAALIMTGPPFEGRVPIIVMP